jgi:predicted DNA-binding protein
MQTDEMREKQLNIRLSAEESERLDRVADHYGLNSAGLIRMLLKREDLAIAASPISQYAAKVLAHVETKTKEAATVKASKKPAKKK